MHAGHYYAVKPVVTSDELTIYFGAANEVDGLNGTRIRRASRASVLDPFGASVEVTELRGAKRACWRGSPRVAVT
jgi:hypothetical protein